MHRGRDAPVFDREHSRHMERKTTTQKDGAPAQGGRLLNGRASAVGASVCGVVGKHGSGLGRLIGADQEVLTLGDWAEYLRISDKYGKRYPAFFPVMDALRCVTGREVQQSGKRCRPADFLDVV